MAKGLLKVRKYETLFGDNGYIMKFITNAMYSTRKGWRARKFNYGKKASFNTSFNYIRGHSHST